MKYTKISAMFIALTVVSFVQADRADADKNTMTPSSTGAKTKVDPIPPGYHTVTPYLTVNHASDAIAFYTKAFGAEERDRVSTPDGSRIIHAEMKIGDSIVMICDPFFNPIPETQEVQQPASMLHLYCTDVDSSFERAVKAGCKVQFPLQNCFWGDRFGAVVDPFGKEWSLSTHIEDVPKGELSERAKAWFQKLSAATDKSVQQANIDAARK